MPRKAQRKRVVCVPEGLSLENCTEHELLAVFLLLEKGRKEHAEQWLNLHSAELLARIGGAYNKTMQSLTSKSIIEVNNSYATDRFSKSYRLTEKYRDVELTRLYIPDRRIRKKPKQSSAAPSDKTIKHMVFCLGCARVDWDGLYEEIEGSNTHDLNSALLESAGRDIEEGHIWATRGKNVIRVFGTWTNAPSLLRQFLTVEGKPLVECDVKSMHAILLAALYDRGEEACPVELVEHAKFRLAHQEDFYQAITPPGYMPKSKPEVRRKRVKSLFLTHLNRKPDQPINQIGVHFDQIFPILGRKMEAIEHKARWLQNLEAKIIVDGVGAYAAQKDIWFASVHDGWLCREEDREELINVAITEVGNACLMPARITSS